MTPAEFAMRRPVTVIMLFVSLMVIGIISARFLPMEYFPSIDAPVVFLDIPYPGSTPEEVEQQITKPVEEVVATLSGITSLESTSSNNGAQIQAQFDWTTDIGVKAVEARERVDAIRDQLPADLRRINVLKFNTSDQPVLTLRISSQRDLSNVYDMIMRILVRPLERLPGVARVQLQGLEPKEIRIDLNADRVKAHAIDLNDLQQRLRAMNFLATAGNIEEAGNRYLVQPNGTLQSVDELRALVINDQGLRLRDIAVITYASARRDYARHLDQKYAIGISVFKESGANLVDVGRRVLAEVEEIGESQEMQGINLFFLENQAQGVTDSLRELLKAGLIGALLSLSVLYFFLRNWTVTAMVSLSVPIAITITLGVMYFTGISLNILSMMGLMLAIGMLVDNSVVVSESIFTEREKTPDQPRAAALRGVKSVGLAVAAGTLTSAAVFLPIIFGEVNEISIFLLHVAVAICASLGVSLLIAQTIIPMIASRINPQGEIKQSKFQNWLRHHYTRLLKWTLKHPLISALAIVLMFFSVIIPAIFVETDMFPQNQTRRLFMHYHLDSHYPLSRVKQAVDRVEDYLYAQQEEFEIKAVYSYYDETGIAQSSILLNDYTEAERSSEEIGQAILEGLPKIAIGRPSFEWNRAGGKEGVSITLTGRSSEQLKATAREVMRLFEALPEFSGLRTSYGAGDRELQVQIDRAQASQLGFSAEEISNVIAIALRGVQLREFRSEQGEVPILLQFAETDRSAREMLASLTVRNAAGEAIPLSALVKVVERAGPISIQHVDRETGIKVQANLEDITMEQARELIQQKMDLFPMPSGYAWDFGSGFQQDQQALYKMIFNILLAMLIIYIVLAAQFESLLYPLSMIASILFSIVGVYWFFLFTGTTFSITSMIGILILIGVVVNNGIVLIDHINQLRRAGLPRNEAVLQAGRDRLRPILMTAGTTVLGLLPLCVGVTQIGGNGPPYYPMARAIVGGLLFSTIVSLLFLPSIYNYLDWAGRLIRRLFSWLTGLFRRRTRQAV